ncbi:SPOR domain-containing protein [Ralstonia pseudosolanacearum]|uniref:SPOR domain-containing protein n=1 Tax=Ralstonia pseudosolanacearum TaxID=1310165 RepID=UPI000B3B0BB1|nr:SPOR domain-containing protein [Ralstonia pseudosolanacearum]MDO3528752.1 SPOR domain-containing protein [Ralstonia pseudosolanacearum]MDO3533262.1 SPOR domain-containing protein [Ralstonia pseudosolanacearum]
MTLRLALLLLLLANGVLLAANLGVFGPDIPSAWFESEREPDRMQRQIRTEDIRLLEPASASTPAAPKAAPAPTPAPAASSPEAASAPAAASDAGPAIERTALAAADTTTAANCMELGGLTDAQAARGTDQLRQLAGVQVERVTRQDDIRWWVHMPSRGTREDADRKVTELKRRNVADSAIVQEAGGFVVSLGLFRDKGRAQQRLDDLRAHDVRTAVLTETHRNASRAWLRITASGDAAPDLAAQLATLKTRLGADELRACTAPQAATLAAAH